MYVGFGPETRLCCRRQRAESRQLLRARQKINGVHVSFQQRQSLKCQPSWRGSDVVRECLTCCLFLLHGTDGGKSSGVQSIPLRDAQVG